MKFIYRFHANIERPLHCQVGVIGRISILPNHGDGAITKVEKSAGWKRPIEIFATVKELLNPKT